MRLFLLTVSGSVLLSGCSWFGGQASNNAHGQQANGRYAAPQVQQGQGQAWRQGKAQGGCKVFHAAQPAPRGCSPEQVTIATGGGQYNNAQGGFAQQPNFAGGYGASLATGGFGSHASVKRSAVDYHVSNKAQTRRPRFRGQFSIGGEKSISGDLLDLSTSETLASFLPYNPRAFEEGVVVGTPASGQVTTTTYTSVVERRDNNSASFEDAYSTPLNVRGGFEYIVSPQTTVFANAGYVYAEGERASSGNVQAELQRIDVVENFDPATGLSLGSSTNVAFIPNVDVATFGLEFSDLERIDLEVGARQYLSPVLKNATNASITPFVGGSVGAARYNDQRATVTQNQLFLERAFESNNVDREFFDVLGDRAGPAVGVEVDLFNAQWVPTGTVTAGIEWQATPRTAIAFESGIRYEGGRDAVNGVKGDDNLSIPFTIRGSYNF